MGSSQLDQLIHNGVSMKTSIAKKMLLWNMDQDGKELNKESQVLGYIEAYQNDETRPWDDATKICEVQAMFWDYLDDTADSHFNPEMARAILWNTLHPTDAVHIEDYLVMVQEFEDEAGEGMYWKDYEGLDDLIHGFNEFVHKSGF